MELGDYTKPKQSEFYNSNQPPAPAQPIKKDVNLSPQQYKEHYNPQLEKSGLRIVNSGWDTFVNFFFILTIILILVGGGFFLYLVHEGKFQSNSTSTCENKCPDVPACPACPSFPSIPACPTPILNSTCNPTLICGGNSSV